MTEEYKFTYFANGVLPFAIIAGLISTLSKPKREDVGYKVTIHLQSFIFAVVGEGGNATGLLRGTPNVQAGVGALLRIPLFYVIMWVIWKIRDLIAKVRRDREHTVPCI